LASSTLIEPFWLASYSSLDSLDRQFGQMFQLGRALRFKRIFELKEAVDRERDKAQEDEANNPISFKPRGAPRLMSLCSGDEATMRKS
jgi:hypothetical protein